jgi:purine catabolism regulator
VAGAVAEAAFVVDVAMATGRSAAGRVWRSADLGVQGLLWQLRTDPRLLSYVDAQLAPLLRLDDRVRGQMLETLSAYLEAGSGMTAFAERINLSRPAAYARLDRLRQVLGCDLNQPRTRLSLHVAMLALQQDRDNTAPGHGTAAAESSDTAREAGGAPRRRCS